MSTRFQYNSGPLDAVEASSPRDFALSTFEFGPYQSEATQRFIYGTRFLMWDGRVFKYCLTQGEIESYHGVRDNNDAALSYTAAPLAASIGDRMVQITLASRSEDDLVGGYIALYDGGDIDTTNQRGIIGNTASDTTVDVYIDFPLHQAIIATTDAMEVFENPYRAITEVSGATSAWVGVPCVSCAAELNTWIQTWGPCMVSPGNQTLDDAAANERMTFWMSNAVIGEVDGAGITASKNQIAGYILNGGTAGIAGPIIMLMCST